MDASWIILIAVAALGLSGIRIVKQYQCAVVLRLGRYQDTRGPGIFWLIPLIEWQQLVDLRTVTAAVEEQETITKDNVPVKINAVVWYRIVDPRQATLEVRSVDNAVIQVALTTLRTGIGQYTLDDVLKAQDTVSKTIEGKIDAVTEPWGVKVERVEMKNVEIPATMQRAIAQEAEAQHMPLMRFLSPCSLSGLTANPLILLKWYYFLEAKLLSDAKSDRLLD
jgi:regulator of protease activity HflC (stomatin/prohibitin superfamily)